MNLQNITQQYLKIFPGDFSGNPQQRQTPKVLFSTVETVGFDHPEIIIFNEKLSDEIGLGKFQKNDFNFLYIIILLANRTNFTIFLETFEA